MVFARGRELVKREGGVVERDSGVVERDALMIEREPGLVERDMGSVERDVGLDERAEWLDKRILLVRKGDWRCFIVAIFTASSVHRNKKYYYTDASMKNMI